MAAPRATQFIALRNLSRHGAHQQVRSLHMTGPATYASPVLTKERPILNLPRDIASLRAECKRRKIETTGSKQDLVSRLNADELFNSRAFSTAAAAAASQARPVAPAVDANGKQIRHFNTSRTLKAVNDTSTIDFAYFPTDLSFSGSGDVYSSVRVPILPTSTATHNIRTSTLHTAGDAAADAPVMRPLISAMSGDMAGRAQPLAEMSDCHGLHIDFHAIADGVAASLEQNVRKPVEKQVSVMSQILGDMVVDVMGLGKRVALK